MNYTVHSAAKVLSAIVGLLAMALAPDTIVAAQTVDSASVIAGLYEGTYICAQGKTKLQLSIAPADDGTIVALFRFYLPRASKDGFAFSLRGRFNGSNRTLQLNPMKWETVAPVDYVMVGMNGRFDPNRGIGAIDGTIPMTGCTTFQVDRKKNKAVDRILIELLTPPAATAAIVRSQCQRHAAPFTSDRYGRPADADQRSGHDAFRSVQAA